MMKRRASLFAFALLAAGLVPAAHGTGLVYALKGERNTVYLAGSVHLLKQSDSQLPPALERAYAEAEQLVMEIDMDDLDATAAAAWMMERGMSTDGATLRETLGEPLQWARLDGRR